ncbi:hypothetical protein Pmar_PMAR027769 [Perkinsus marinus ATCC 50983]|uniref:Uncharacterized protein n=1 Tax=Perkinsus marinus (strain ATCC 50983 / TXsc) TaxID=423536 RepID=C5LS63_PERM5|nr:hypothetical protein Pmar_PMAR027769 [Perkinsus marinus ATCC 50983]EER00425.1 hypothetical protein Pmar_PMAR027769 [Perkinsus marinus ATCC 50983]|eukprot:XP_002767707.1 hypothetical protein Pmar_PMAR027769 [Perkinsus marinus ATCC 50983]
MLRIDLGAPSGFMTLPVSVLMGKVFPKRRMTYWDRSSGFVAGTIELGFSCKQYEETVTGPGAMALQLAAAVPNQGSMKLEEAEEVTQEIQSPYLKELIIEIAALEDLNNQLRSKIAVLINESDVGHELGRTKQAS